MLTKAAYEGARLVVCTPDSGPTGRNTCCRNLLERLVVSTITVPDMAIYIAKGDQKPFKKPDWTSHLSLIDGKINCVPCEDLDYLLLSCCMNTRGGVWMTRRKKSLPISRSPPELRHTLATVPMTS